MDKTYKSCTSAKNSLQRVTSFFALGYCSRSTSVSGAPVLLLVVVVVVVDILSTLICCEFLESDVKGNRSPINGEECDSYTPPVSPELV